MIEIFGYQIELGLFLAIVGIVVAVIIGVVHYALVEKTKKEAKRAKEEAIAAKEEATKATKEAREAKENIINIEKHLGIPIYVDGLTSADPPIFDPFLEGTKLMAEYKWDEAISEFQKAMKEAKASQLVALFNLIAICYYTSGRQALALENYEESLKLAREFDDKQGEANALGNIGAIYQIKGDLDQALKYHQEALKIHKEIGFREGEASDLGNIGLIYRAKGDLNQALKYYNEALKIFQEIGMQPQVEQTLRNINSIKEQKKR